LTWRPGSCGEKIAVVSPAIKGRRSITMEVVTRLGIADASTLLREGLMRVLGDKKDVSVVGQAANDVETMELVEQRNNVDVLLLDLNIPKLEAIPILLALKEQNLATKVLILSNFTDESKILNSAKVGARGYILKSTSSVALVEAIREVSRGRVWVDRQAYFADTFAVLAHLANPANEISGEVNPFDILSKRELEILNLLARGVSNEDMGKKLFISLPTVKGHVSHILRKLNVKNRTQAALLLMQARSRDGALTYPVIHAA